MLPKTVLISIDGIFSLCPSRYAIKCILSISLNDHEGSFKQYPFILHMVRFIKIFRFCEVNSNDYFYYFSSCLTIGTQTSDSIYQKYVTEFQDTLKIDLEDIRSRKNFHNLTGFDHYNYHSVDEILDYINQVSK